MRKILPIVFAIFISSLSLKSQSNLWGVTTSGGNGAGSIFGLPTGGTAFSSQFNLTDNGGSAPSTIKMLEVTGKLYGMTPTGGANNSGVIFEYDPVNNTYTKKFDFAATTGTTGSQPAGSLIQASSNGKLYGMARVGGANGVGTIFEYVPSTNTFSTLTVFTAATGTALGSQPSGALLEASNGKLYGLTRTGGAGGFGAIFEFNPATNTYSVLASFTGGTGMVAGANPLGSLIEGALGKLYGTTSAGGANNVGVMFEYDLSTFTYTKLVDFVAATGSAPQGTLLKASNGKLYGTTLSGGANSVGTIFSYDLTNSTYSLEASMVAASGSSPYSTLLQASNGKLYGTTRTGGTSSSGVVFEYDIISSTYTKRVDMVSASTGGFSQSSFVQFSGNNKLYALTTQGGANASGVIFEFDPATNTVARKIDLAAVTTGGKPSGGVVLASNNKLYGMTSSGGTASSLSGGVIFEYDQTTNTYVKKADLTSINGRFAYGAFVQHTNSLLYGVTSAGGSGGFGSIIQYAPGGTSYTKLLDFNGNTMGGTPYGSMILAPNGNLYGLTSAGGSNGLGVLFEYNVAISAFTVKYNFTAADGANPFGSLYIASNGKAYGMTSAGGANGMGVIFDYDITNNVYTKRVDLTSASGATPYGSLVQANGNFLYALTSKGGTNNMGALIEFDMTNNTYSQKQAFSAATGANPWGSLTKAANGKLYGLTNTSGANGVGTMFEYDPATITFTKKMDLSVTTGGSPAYTQMLEICTLPAAAGAITAAVNAVCATDATARSFSISTIANAASYTTIVPSGAVITSGANTNAFNVNFASLAAGVYTVSVAGTNICGTGTLSSKVVTVNTLPVVTVNSGTICSGSTFTINPSGASSYTFEGGSPNVSPTTSTNYTVIGSDANGCVSSAPATSSVTVNAAPVISVNSGSICNGSSFTINPSGASSYVIEGGSAIVSPGTTTTYTVTGTGANGCTATGVATSTVTVYNHPTISATSGSICSGNSFSIVPSGAASYVITGGSFNVSPSATASYSVTGTSPEGCSSTNTAVATVTVYTTPTISVNSGSICSGKSFTITPAGADSYNISGGSAIVSPAATTDYTVTGMSSNGCAASNTAISSVTVNITPTVTATSGTICSGNTFSITPGGASSYTITGNSFVVSPNTTTSYSLTGTSAAGCVSTNTAVSTITVYATPTIAATSGSICSGSFFNIVPSGAGTGGLYSISGNNFSVSPASNTNYLVTGTTSAGCAGNTATAVVTVTQTPVIFVLSGTICAGSSYSINAGGASTYTITGGSFNVSPATTTTYSITGTANGCVSSAPAIATVVVIATPTISVNSGSVCAGQQFTISPGGGDSYTVTGNNFTVSPTTNTTYVVTGSNLGCPAGNSATATVNVQALPVISISSPSAICIGSTTDLVASGGVTYTWTPSASGATNTVSPAITTGYTVTGFDAAGCSASASTTLVVNTLPNITVASGAVCPGESFTLQPTGGVTYTYSSGSDIVTPSTTTDYTVVGEDANGCTSAVPAIASITVTTQLPVSISGVSSACQGSPVVLTAGGASTYSWNTGTQTSTVSVIPTSAITVYTVTGSSGSCSNTATFTVATISLPPVQITSSSPTICIGGTASLTASGATSYTWSTTQNVTEIAVSPGTTTTYTLTGTDATCANTVTFTQEVSVCEGIASLSANNAVFSIYPNPNNGTFSIDAPAEISIQVLNTLGSVIATQQLQAGVNTVNLEKHAKGIYFVQAVYNKQVKTVRVAVQ